MNYLAEEKRSELLNKSKRADNYAINNQQYGKNRYERRVRSKVGTSVKEYNQINMNELFKNNVLIVNVPVNGETNNYIVTIKFNGILDAIHRELKNDQKVDLRIILKAIINSFNRDDVYIHCSCDDWCLDKDTKIKLLSGEVITVQEMLSRYESGEKLWVYSTDEQGDFRPGEVTDVWISGYTKEFIKVTLDNNSEILTTPNHKYMLRDGSYVEASSLQIGQSLMPLYFKYTNGYESIKQNSITYPTKYFSVYKQVANSCLQEDISKAKDRSGEDIISIHHKNFIKLDNRPENLYPMGREEHILWHSKHVRESGTLAKFIAGGQSRNQRIKNRSSEEYEFQAEVMRQAMKSFYADASEEELAEIAEKRRAGHQKAIERGCFNTKKFKAAAKQRGIDMHTPECEALAAAGIRKYWENLSEENRNRRADITRANQKKSIEKIKGVPLSIEHKEKIRASRQNESADQLKVRVNKCNLSKIKPVIDYMLANNISFTDDNYTASRKKLGKLTLTLDTLKKKFDSLENCLHLLGISDKYNHKIVKIETVIKEDAVPVYDISVKEYNNFYVDAGVILHNCYRFSYWSRVNDISSDPSIEQTNNGRRIVNPNDTKGRGCKHSLLVLSNNRWLRQVASVIYNYINYMEKHYQRMYADIIYPAIYEKEYEDDVQLKIDDLEDNDDLISDEEEIDISNKYAKTKNQFKPRNQSGIQFDSNKDSKQFDFDSLMNDEGN